MDKLFLDGKSFNSRLIMGTSLFPNIDILNKSLRNSCCEIITMAVRRLNISGENDFLKQIDKNLNFFQIPQGVIQKRQY